MKWKEMTPRERDMLIHEKIMCKQDEPIPAYTTDLNAAWQVVEQFGRVQIGRNAATGQHREVSEVWLYTDLDPWKYGQGIANTLPEAICLSALHAIGHVIE